MVEKYELILCTAANMLGRWDFRRRKRTAGNRPFHRKALRGAPVGLGDSKAGYFNIMFRMKFQDGGSAAIQYIQDHISIPVPLIQTLTLVSWKCFTNSLRIFYFSSIKYPFLGLDLTYEMACWPLSIHMNELAR